MANNRASTYTQATTSTDNEEKKDMWSSMLDGVASGKRLPEKNILVLGGTADSQREFLEALSIDETRKSQDRQSRKQPPVANNFALGYTYHDVLDADHEDILARLSLYLLADPSPSFTPLMQPLLTPQTIPNTLIVILLDWSQPWFWLRELRDWIRLLRPLLISLDEDCKEKMEEVMISWRDRGRGGSNLDGGGSTAIDGDVSLPLGPGEWEEALGLPLCVVCQNSDKIDTLEKERSWKEDEFDFVLQSLRTILLKRRFDLYYIYIYMLTISDGASLIYTTPGITSPLQGLIHSSLGIHSLLKRQPIRHNVIDRDKVVVPPNWDSWGKIRVLREGFDVEEVNKGWSLDIEEDSGPTANGDGTSTPSQPGELISEGGAVSAYEEVIQDPSLDALQATSAESQGLKLEVFSLDTQNFLASQVEVLHTISQGPDVSSVDSTRLINGRKVSSEYGNGEEKAPDEGKVSEHIGPVQFNMGGIQVDADDMLQRLRDRQAYSSPEPAAPGARADASADGKVQNEALASFFAGLMKRGGSAQNSPKPGASS
ncbi:hypothetical protein DSL72_009295 [Monilinia vaccinii-corymbosi]|uniref:Dynein light intermediate chain n=1 Tax=Monilinia vaccinii-corymbosi TaxID=61207 RepID=A0A8A3PQS7_9HELO|nr:hypothetical protein DSL72_009295 [Monilinia vaccinii-corymbosi]